MYFSGYVSPPNVSDIIAAHIDKSDVVQDLWRGRMGE